MYTKQLSLLILLLMLVTSLQAQITIGIDQKPIAGALLDLKDNESGTSTKGLGLPRVALTHRSHLTPMFELNASETGYVDAAKSEMDKSHIGLIVYNMGNYDICNDATLQAGIHVWKGDHWYNLEGKNPHPVGETVMIMTYKNNEYHTRDFGMAGRWMTNDLKAEEYDSKRTDGTKFSDLQSIELKTGNFDNNAGSNGTEYWVTNPHQLLKERIYNWQAMTGGRVNDNTTVTLLADEGKKNQKKIQGICPAGWHIPSDYEFILLEKEILAHTDIYSYMKSAEVVAPTNFEAVGWRGEHYGTAMREPCFEAPADSPGPGKSFLNSFGGFEAKLTGFLYTGGVTGRNGAFYWTSSANIIDPTINKRHAMYRTIAGRDRADDGTGVARDKKDIKHFFSVRCVKDGTNDSNNTGWKE